MSSKILPPLLETNIQQFFLNSEDYVYQISIDLIFHQNGYKYEEGSVAFWFVAYKTPIFKLGAVIWSPGTSYDRTTFVGHFL